LIEVLLTFVTLVKSTKKAKASALPARVFLSMINFYCPKEARSKEQGRFIISSALYIQTKKSKYETAFSSYYTFLPLLYYEGRYARNPLSVRIPLVNEKLTTIFLEDTSIYSRPQHEILASTP